MSDTSKSTPPTTGQIRERAYGIYLARGCEDGHDLSDWIEAERQLSGPNEQEAVGTRKARSAVVGERR
jgi:hypothetical protein